MMYQNIQQSTHRARTGEGGEALHPYNPVDRTKFNKDKNQYWKDRLKDNKPRGGK